MNAEPDDVLAQIGRAIGLGHHGDRAGARVVLMEIWEAIGRDGDALHRCALAHSMADVQDDPREELVWDLRALDAAARLTDEGVEAAGLAISARGFYSSLHLNLADVYRRLGAGDEARRQVALGRRTTAALGDDGYRQMITAALDRIERELE
jgi:hypothetical protein